MTQRVKWNIGVALMCGFSFAAGQEAQQRFYPPYELSWPFMLAALLLTVIGMILTERGDGN